MDRRDGATGDDVHQAGGAGAAGAERRTAQLAERDRREEDERAQAAQLGAILDAVGDGLIVYDREGRTILSTPAADALLGVAVGERRAPVQERAERQYEILDESGHRLCRDEMIAFRAAVKGETVRGTVLRVRAGDAPPRWLRMTAIPFFVEGRHAGAVLSMTDVTERKHAEEALRDANERLREADRRKDEFLGMLSHELRNPLAPIRNSLYILDHCEPGGQHARRAKEIASRQIAYLTRLVDDLLDVTRIARGKIELRRAPLDLAALARRTAEDHRALMHDRSLELAVEVPPEPLVVNGDETRLAQVLGNLLHNAAKFTPGGGRVALAVRVEDGRAVVHVRDTGAGIAPDVLPTIFEPFTQAEQTLARSEGGLGLGLALVRGLVALHGGEVAAVSPGPGNGTDFVVTLPLAAPRGDAANEDRAPTAGAPDRARRVLVIDDNRDAADSLAQLVAMLGHTTDVAYDAIDGLAKASEHAPDVVLCDIGLPGMDGYEFARRFRARSRRRDVRLVAVSGYAQPDDVARAAEAGFDAHVAKPPDPERLEEVLGPSA